MNSSPSMRQVRSRLTALLVPDGDRLSVESDDPTVGDGDPEQVARQARSSAGTVTVMWK
jgi:hypothetical protein